MLQENRAYDLIPYVLFMQAPQPVESWTGVRDCTKEGNECPQLHMFFNYYVGKEEDCLNLSVHTREVSN